MEGLQRNQKKFEDALSRFLIPTETDDMLPNKIKEE